MRYLFVIGVAAALAGSASAQELSQDVYPSEDELHEALLAGEIDPYQYAVLVEIITIGADSSSRYLLDEIPNLSHFLRMARSLSTDLERDQTMPFVRQESATGCPRVSWRHQYTTELNEEPGTRYRSHIGLKLGRGWSSDLRLHREYDGVERVVRRSLTYQSSDGGKYRLTLGTFTARLGLGAAFGHHGKILDYSERLEGESWLMPDYGGFNGLYFRQRRSLDLQVLISTNRDVDHELSSAAVMIADSRGSIQPGLVIGVNRIRSRLAGTTVYDVKYGAVCYHRYSGGYASGEVVGQAGVRPSCGAAVLEGAHRFQGAQVRYSGWWYDDDYLDLTGGSKAGSLRRTVNLADVDLEYSDKRSGQAGGLLKTIVLLNDHVEVVNSFLAAYRGHDTARVQFLSGATYRYSSRSSMSLDYLLRSYRRHDISSHRETIQHRTRWEGRYQDHALAIRLEFAYVTQRQRRDGLAVLAHVKLYDRSWGDCELWANLSRIEAEVMSVENGYGFLRSVQNISDDATIAVKLSHRYSRNAADKYQTTFSLELALQY